MAPRADRYTRVISRCVRTAHAVRAALTAAEDPSSRARARHVPLFVPLRPRGARERRPPEKKMVPVILN